MAFSDVVSAMAALSFPVEFDHVKIGTHVPFGTYTFSVEPVSADNSVLIKQYQFTLRIFTEKLDAELDAEIEKMFSDLDIVWTRDEPEYDEDSETYEIDYDFGVIG